MQIRGNNMKRFTSSILIFALIISVMTGCSAKGNSTVPGETEQSTQNQESGQTEAKQLETLPLDTVLITVDDKEYTLSDMMYLIYSQEQYFNQMAIQYTEVDGIDFWNDILEENTNETGREMAEQDTVDMMKRLIILGQEAEENKFKLSSEEQEDVAFYVQEVLENMDDEHKQRTGFTKENLETLVKQYLVVRAYYQQQVEKETVDEEAIRASVEYDEYQQREIETVFIQTVDTDAEGTEKEKPVEDVVELVKLGNRILEQAKEGTALEDAFDALVTEDMIDVYYNDYSLSDDDMSEELLQAVDSLKEGQIYDKLVETDGGYYIVKLVNSKSMELFDDAVLNEIETQKQLSYNETLETLYEEHSIIVNEEAFSKLVLETYAYTQREEAEIDDSKFFEDSDSSSQDSNVLTDDAANGDDGSVG